MGVRSEWLLILQSKHENGDGNYEAGLNGTSLGFITLPTFYLLILSWILFVGAIYSGSQSVLPIWVCMLVNSFAAYLAYSVVHEASHYLLSTEVWLNDLLGHLAMLLLTPTLGFLLYRAVHFCHHQHTNHTERTDPDLWLSSGPLLLKLVKWVSMDLYYFHFYIRRLAFKTRSTTLLPLLAITSSACFIGLVHFQGWWEPFLLYMVIPTRLTNLFLSWTFAYLPHAPHVASEENDPYVTTNNDLTDKPWMNVILLGHSYHIVHHLHPSIPFFRYAKTWQFIQTKKAVKKEPVD